MNNPDLAQQLSQAGRALACKYTWQARAEVMKQVVTEAIS